MGREEVSIAEVKVFDSFVIQLVIGGLALGALYALAAIGLVVIHKATRGVNFIHGAFIMLGAYSAWLMGVWLKWPVWAVYLLGPAIVGIIAAAIEAAILRSLRHSDPFAAILATVFLGLALVELARIYFGADILAVTSPVARFQPLEFGDLLIMPETLWMTAGTLLFAVSAIFLFAKARLGIGMRAMASNSRGAQLSGFAADSVFAQAWFIGGFLAGAAGLFTAPLLGVSPELAIGLIVPAFVAAVLGGLDSLVGAIIGGLFLGLIETFAGAYGSGALQGAVSFAILVVVLLIKPNGLFESAKIRHV